MPRSSKRIFTCDAETDPFVSGRIPFPFIWGLYDGKTFHTFPDTGSLVRVVCDLDIILYAHNGGKFDFLYFLPFVKETKAQIINGRIVSMFLGCCELRDSFSIIPEPLKNFGDKREIDYTKLEASVRERHMPEIREYLFYDCKILHDAVVAYNHAAGKKKTIASNALAYSRKLGINPGKTNARFDAKYRRFYYGGRTECFFPGTHEKGKLLDIHSAYPYAMSHDHASGNEFDRLGSIDGMTDEEISRSFIVLECWSDGAFPQRRIGPDGGLAFPVGYGEYYVTGWEYIVARDFGLIRDVKIYSVRTTRKTINFGAYVQHWYEKKKNTSKKENLIQYTIAKIMMNSLYGKLAQNPAKYYDYKIMPGGSKICEFVIDLSSDEKDDPTICKECGLKDSDHGWQLGTEFGQHEIHRRPSLFKYKLRYGADWEARSLYNNVATGASITGFTRAHLLRAMCLVGRENVIYCDTDSIVLKAGTDISAIPQSEVLGDWELEADGFPIGHFAGKKLYAIRLGKHVHKNCHPSCKLIWDDKIASKGSKLVFDDLKDILNGKTVVWKNQAPSFSITSGNVPIPNDDGSPVYNPDMFVVRKIRQTAKRG